MTRKEKREAYILERFPRYTGKDSLPEYVIENRDSIVDALLSLAEKLDEVAPGEFSDLWLFGTSEPMDEPASLRLTDCKFRP